ncbi:glycosyltransferase [Paenibacillus dendritiformis]|uniref:glycosyltransferase n=1 Tax=Paenibacillus dendritiformis TaxID=130049 RepID=UPI0015EBE103|nr:glycosyltransferase [Paenibacillus dendritiformis]
MNYPVSIIIRTKNRPKLLRRALVSLRRQSFTDFEVNIVEDGKPHSRSICDEFSDLSIQYYSTNEQVGRARAANIGMDLSSGYYLNFLDDDDFLLPNHIETMLKKFEEKNEADVVYGRSIERKDNFVTEKLDDSFCDSGRVRNFGELDKQKIFFQNYFPIQAVMFKKELYECYGGMDESLKYLEDWDLWIKYSMVAVFCYTDEITSVYHVPNKRNERKERERILKNYECVIKEKYKQKRIVLNIKQPNLIDKIVGKIKREGIRGLILDIFNKIT